MCANTAPAPVVLEPPTPPAHIPLSAHCRQLAPPTPAMSAIAAVSPQASPVVLRTPDVAKDNRAPSFELRSTTERQTKQPSSPKTSASTFTAASSVTPSPKSKDTPAKTPTKCEGCSQSHDGSYGSGRFCSVHCARRIAASRKWEKQRSQRKRAAAAAAAAAAANVDHSTSSMSSASSDDHATQKRQRVVVMQGMIPAPHVVHHPNLVHPQPQHFPRSFSFTGMQPHPYSASPLSGTPTPPPQPPHYALSPYMDYSSVTPRALTPVQYHSGYYPYSSPMPYTSTPPPYALYPSHSPHHIPRPPPPTPGQEILNRTNAPLTSSCVANPRVCATPNRDAAQQRLVSSESECEAVAEALLYLKTSSNTD